MLRERAGTDMLELELACGATVADALREIEGGEPLGALLRQMPVHMAVNREYARPQTKLSPRDELALIPPLSGGAAPGHADMHPRVHVRVSEEPLSVEALAAVVADDRAGAIVIFQGVTREVARLEYEAYAEMARERMEEIMGECIAEYGLLAAAVEHRVGASRWVSRA